MTTSTVDIPRHPFILHPPFVQFLEIWLKKSGSRNSYFFLPIFSRKICWAPSCSISAGSESSEKSSRPALKVGWLMFEWWLFMFFCRFAGISASYFRNSGPSNVFKNLGLGWSIWVNLVFHVNPSDYLPLNFILKRLMLPLTAQRAQRRVKRLVRFSLNH